MKTGVTAPAELPPGGLPGLDPSWSRLVTAIDRDEVELTWHVLDNGVEDPWMTLLCVHGNPTWSYIWRDLVREAPPGVRVVAVDQLDMGFSERSGSIRRLQRRIEDLGTVSDALQLTGPVVTVAHDWGGPISLGWALDHSSQHVGSVLMNTAVHQPPGSPAPRLIRMARSRAILDQLCVKSPGFIRGTLRLARKPLPQSVKRAYHEPYRSADRRHAIGMFVSDIPLEPDHPSAAALSDIADGLVELKDVPALLLWGPSDPVFSDLYLRDLQARLPQADVHRFAGAGHLLAEDADIATPIFEWLARLGQPESRDEVAPAGRSALWQAIDRRSEDRDVAVVEMKADEAVRSISFADLAGDVRHLAAGLAAAGVSKGDRVALLVPPGIDLTACVYACWRLGAVVVIADAGLGAGGMTKALKSAAPKYLIGITKALVAARSLRWPGQRISVEPISATRSRALRVWTDLGDIRERGARAPQPDPPGDGAVAAVVFTSGATGPAKGVTYRHQQAQAQRDALMRLYDIRQADRLVAAFAPFALYGPTMGIPSVVPDMDVTAPGTLTATGLAAAVGELDATLVFASPAALTNVVATVDELTPKMRQALSGVRLLMSAGAPVPASLLRKVASVVPNAEIHTPYGMTEVLPVADITLEEIESVASGNGVCVGMPVAGVDVAVIPIDENGHASGGLVTDPDVVGEVCIRAPHAKDQYDKLWVTEHASAEPGGWHRSGDVGHIDGQGRLWIEGRMIHIITSPEGLLTPVGIEHAAETVPGVAQAAVVGVGPAGTQQVVVVAALENPVRTPSLAGNELADEVRKAASVPVAAVLVVPSLPVDKRHNSKIDRTRVATWASDVTAGKRMRRL